MSGAKRVATVLVTGVLLVGVVAGAQGNSGGVQNDQSDVQREEVRPFGASHRARGVRGLPVGRLALGTTVEATLYDGDPAEGGSELETLSLTYGEDSEAAFAEQLAAARQNASYLQVDVGEQTRTVDLSSVDTSGDGRGPLPRLSLRRGFGEGDSVTATFYDGDPEAGGSEQQTLTFVYGQDSAAGFANLFRDAAQDAAFVTVVTSPQSYALDLSARAERAPRGFGGGQR